MKWIVGVGLLSLCGCACWDGFVRERDITMRVVPVSTTTRVYTLTSAHDPYQRCETEAPVEIHPTNGVFCFQTPWLRAGGYAIYPLFRTTQVHGDDMPFLRIQTPGYDRILSVREVWKLPKDRNGTSTFKLQRKAGTQQGVGR